MPRTARVMAENGIYYVVNRGNGWTVVFRKPSGNKVWLARLQDDGLPGRSGKKLGGSIHVRKRTGKIWLPSRV